MTSQHLRGVTRHKPIEIPVETRINLLRKAELCLDKLCETKARPEIHKLKIHLHK